MYMTRNRSPHVHIWSIENTSSRDCDTGQTVDYKTDSSTEEKDLTIMLAVGTLHTFIPSVKLLAVLVMVSSSLQVAVTESWCTSDSCGDNQVCCGSNGCIWASNCLGQCCSSDSDCFKDESCCSSECSHMSSCLGQSCNYDSDCSGGQSCCSSECRDSADCVGYPCYSASDCHQREFCCDGTCSYADCYIPTASVEIEDNTSLIVGTLLGSLAFGFIVTLCIFNCRRQRPVTSVLVADQRVQTTYTGTVEHPAQINSPYPGQATPSYQQGYPYCTRLQYEQHQTIQTPYKPDGTEASEQPPPYSELPRENPRGVLPQRTYGAIPSTSMST